MARNVSFLEELPDNVEHADLLGKIQDINEPQLCVWRTSTYLFVLTPSWRSKSTVEQVCNSGK